MKIIIVILTIHNIKFGNLNENWSKLENYLSISQLKINFHLLYIEREIYIHNISKSSQFIIIIKCYWVEK